MGGRAGGAAAAHAAPPGLGLTALWNEWLRYGIGPAPDPSEPWRPQWLLLPWLGLAGVAFALRPRGGGRAHHVVLHSGDLLVMGGRCQKTHLHSVPKENLSGGRISVIFRS